MDLLAEYKLKRDKLIEELALARKQGMGIGLQKQTSNLFRQRDQKGTKKIDVRKFNRVLSVDKKRMTADVEGMTTYEAFVDATLEHGLLPTVVPQLKTITVGGAVSGVGIESSSFKYGLVHETIEEMEILLGNGKVVICSAQKNKDLFYGFPNSYGTLGYALRLKVKLIPAKKYVTLTHAKFTDRAKYFAHIERLCSRAKVDYVDGAIFSKTEMYVTTGEFRDSAPSASDYTYLRQYYRSIQKKKTDYLTVKDYIWRWDTDWFWCSKHFFVQHLPVRLLATKWLLNSATYQRIMRFANRTLPKSTKTESVIQDVDIPIGNAPRFFDFLLAEIRVTPIWVCPFKSYDPGVTFDLYALDPKKLYVNFGFWDTVPTTHEDGYYNKKIERLAFELKGKKGLYSSAYYDEKTFWKIYNKVRYDTLKKKYDSGGAFKDLYEKTVRRK